MGIDIITKDPKRIRNLSEVEDILSKIISYEMEKRSKSGVLLLQNRQLGAIYCITTESEAHNKINKQILNESESCEWGVKFYSRSYFEDLKKRLERGFPRQRTYCNRGGY